jgi:hypothetical protein
MINQMPKIRTRNNTMGRFITFKSFVSTFSLFMLLLWGMSTPCHAIGSKKDWDSAFQSRYGTSTPLTGISISRSTDLADLFSWDAHYWIRAYVSMAQTYGDPSYLDHAVKLIDFMFYNTDRNRQGRGQINVASEPYRSAPLYFLTRPGTPAPGWRRWAGEWRIQTLDDGQITQAIMRFVDLVYSDPRFPGYKTKAQQYLAACEEIVKNHDSLYVYNRSAGITGSYYYPRPDGTGLYSGAVPYNHSATMGTTLLLLDKVKGGVPEYRRKAEAILDYLKNSWRLQNNRYVWDYHPQQPSVGGVEDFNHAHIDLSFVVLAYKRGLNLTRDDMRRFANTLNQMYLGNGEITWKVDGTQTNTAKNYWPIGFDWIDLAEFDPAVLNIAKTVYAKHYPNPTWSRPFLGWAEILRWSAPAPATTQISAPRNLRIVSTR